MRRGLGRPPPRAQPALARRKRARSYRIYAAESPACPTCRYGYRHVGHHCGDRSLRLLCRDGGNGLAVMSIYSGPSPVDWLRYPAAVSLAGVDRPQVNDACNQVSMHGS